MEWIEIAKAEELSPGFHVRTIGRPRLILANVDGGLSAFNARCPHSNGPLEFCETEGAEIVCPLHGWRFDLQRGGCETHGYRPLQMYELSVKDGAVFVQLTSEVKPGANSPNGTSND